MSPIRILHVLGTLRRGGAELRTLEVMKACPPGRFIFDCLALSGRPGELDAEIEALGGAVHHVARGPLFGARLAKILRAGRYDVLHSHVLYYSGFILRAGHHAGIPRRIAHFRSSDTLSARNPLKNSWHSLGRELISQHATVIAGVSEAALRGIWGPDWAEDPRCRVIYNGIDLDRFRVPPDREGVRAEFDLPKDCALIIHVGNVSPAKNHRRLIQMYKEVARTRPEIAMLLIGEGTMELVNRPEDHLPFLRATGPCSNVSRLLSAADMQIHPSLSEGLPGAVLEGVAARLPILVSDIPAMREISKYTRRIQLESLNEDDFHWGIVIGKMIKCKGHKKEDAGAQFPEAFTLRSSVDAMQQCWGIQ